MSYHTRLELEWDDTGAKQAVDQESVVERVKAYLDDHDLSHDVLADLREALEGSLNCGTGFNGMGSDLIIDMLVYLSRGFPDARFFARGTGEELLDLWFRELQNGEVIQAHGPWNE
jgi:hypothetical protein